MLELARRIALGMDVRDFLELERAFERDRRTGAAAEVEHVTGFCQITHELLDLRSRRLPGRTPAGRARMNPLYLWASKGFELIAEIAQPTSADKNSGSSRAHSRRNHPTPWRNAASASRQAS
jgi:hypothetical protein